MKLRFLPILAALLSLGLSASFGYVLHRNHIQAGVERLNTHAQQLEQRMQEHILALRAIKGSFAASKTVPGRQFLKDVIAAFPEQGGAGGAQGYGFALATPTEDDSEAIARVERDYGKVIPPWPATSQPIRFPIVLLEPDNERNRRALNYDMYGEPVRREAMDNAIRSGRAAISRPVDLVQENGVSRQRGFLIYVPLFGHEGVPSSRLSGAEGIVGFVYAPFRAGDLVTSALAEEGRGKVEIEVYSDEIAPDTLLYASGTLPRSAYEVPIRVADRTWMLRLDDRDDQRRINPLILMMLIGIVLAGVAAAMVNTHLTSVEATERLSSERQAHIEQRELMLGEMQHRIKNSIARMLALFRLTARESGDKQALVKSFDKRLQAMARAQALIVSGTSDARTLAEIVAEELDQWTSSGVSILGGPEVRLAPAQVQALGLILHELSTNALKYGALGKGLPLTVGWRREGGTIVLEWQEEIAGVMAEPVKAGSGFGSRFMRMMVEGQLGGSFERQLSADRFAMTIRFPENAPGA